METSADASDALLSGLPYIIFLSLLQSMQTQRRLNDIRALMVRRRMEFVAEMLKSRRNHRRRRQAFISSMLAVVASPTTRRMWVRNRAHDFWTTIEHFDDDQWKTHFRMSRETFDYLVELLAPAITQQSTNFRRPIVPRRRVAIALWWLATPGEYRTISGLFGVGVSTVCKLVRQVTQALVNTLYHRFISLPTGRRLDETVAGFHARGYPQCAGAIDETLIPVNPPREDPADDCSGQGWHSLVLQAVVDHNFCFTDVYIDWPGRTCDARVLANSELFTAAEDGQNGYLFPREKSKFVNGVEIPVHLTGDAAYPLRTWLMTGFTQHHQLSQEEARYTHSLSTARTVVKDAFGRLKGRWRCLMKRNNIDLTVMPSVVTACCILHNICEIQKDSFLPEWNTALEENLSQPVMMDEERPDTAQLIRNTIAANITDMLSD